MAGKFVCSSWEIYWGEQRSSSPASLLTSYSPTSSNSIDLLLAGAFQHPPTSPTSSVVASCSSVPTNALLLHRHPTQWPPARRSLPAHSQQHFCWRHFLLLPPCCAISAGSLFCYRHPSTLFWWCSALPVPSKLAGAISIGTPLAADARCSALPAPF